MCKFRRKKQLVIKSCVQLRRVIRNFTFFFQWSQFIIIIGNILLFMFFSVEGLQKQLDVSLKELDGLKEARERQMQMVSLIM